MNQNLPYQKITIEFNAGQLPPPFCYRYTLMITAAHDQFDLEFAIDYYDRQEISEEEILADGFSMEDDFYWKGQLPEAWTEPINQLFRNLKQAKKAKNDQLKIYSDEKGKTTPLAHDNPGKLEYFLQELIQAIYELNGKQESLLIQAVDRKGKSVTKCNIIISFLNREATRLINEEETKINWKDTKQIMEQIFGLDYDPFNAGNKLPKQNGFFLDPGEGLWYQANKTVKVYDSDEDTEKALKELLGLHK